MRFNIFCGINFLLISISIVFFFLPEIRTNFILNLILCASTYVIFPTFTITLHIVMILLLVYCIKEIYFFLYLDFQILNKIIFFIIEKLQSDTIKIRWLQ